MENNNISYKDMGKKLGGLTPQHLHWWLHKSKNHIDLEITVRFNDLALNNLE